MAVPSWLRIGMAMVALVGSGAASGAAQTCTIELDVAKDYFVPNWVHVFAVSRGAPEVELGKLAVTIRRRIDVAVPAGAAASRWNGWWWSGWGSDECPDKITIVIGLLTLSLI